MRQFVCECLNCGLKKTRQFKEEPYPEYGEVFVAHCKVCDSDQNHTRVLTRKTQAELRRRQEEEDLKKSIRPMCEAWVHLSISVPVSNHHNPFGRLVL